MFSAYSNVLPVLPCSMEIAKREHLSHRCGGESSCFEDLQRRPARKTSATWRENEVDETAMPI